MSLIYNKFFEQINDLFLFVGTKKILKYKATNVSERNIDTFDERILKTYVIADVGVNVGVYVGINGTVNDTINGTVNDTVKLSNIKIISTKLAAI